MKPLVLIVLDGWGIRNSKKGNAIANSRTIFFDRLMETCPHTQLAASGKAVGLPAGLQGNSEVGHLTMGAGRIIPEMITIINQDIQKKSFFRNKAFKDAFEFTKKSKGNIHLMGLLQDQGVHAYDKHLYALIQLAAANRKSFKECFIHVFTDGRDTPPKSCMNYMRGLEREISRQGVGTIATIMGRYYAMDRDNRWQRTKKAYDCLLGKGKKAKSVIDAVTTSYIAKETDEFIQPSVIGNYPGLKNGDAIIFYNYRYDRARQLAHACIDSTFPHFAREKKNIWFSAFTLYEDSFEKKPKFSIAFRSKSVPNIFPEIISKHNLTQLRIAESEKYAHVTYFFNQEKEEPFSGEERILVQSPQVATYDQSPAMSAKQITEAALENISKFDVSIINFANADMLGHTGDLGAAISGIEVLDICLQQVAEEVRRLNGVMIVTADHGNAEEMLTSEGKKETSHTTNPVPFIVFNYPCKLSEGGGLADVAPTMLEILDIPQPKQMTGKSLIKKLK